MSNPKKIDLTAFLQDDDAPMNSPYCLGLECGNLALTIQQFATYATVVMRNRKTSTLPAPRLLCECCGKHISEEEPEYRPEGMIQ